MKVSVIVSIYNGSDIIPLTIPPLLSQDYPKELTEIILVNDASTDDTASLLDLPQWREQCTIIHHTENRGRSATRNSGLQAASGDLLILLDSDMEVPEDFLSKHVALYREENVIGVVSNLLTPDSRSKDKYHRYIFFGKRGARLIGDSKPLPFNYFILGCTSIRAQAVHRTGRFNEDLRSYGIDLEYAYRLWKNYPTGLFYSSQIIVYVHKFKTLEESLNNFREYGRYNVPIILQRFPELAHYVGADFVSTPNGGVSLKTLIGTLLINSVIFKLAKRLLHITPYPLSNVVIRYLLVASAAMGYRESLKNRE